jgi:membrane protease YdiL (CAAX protease family)
MFIEQAYKAKTDWWRYLVGILIIFLGWQLLGIIPLTVVAYLAAGSFEVFFEAAQNNFMDLPIDPNLFLLLLIITFTCGLLGLWFSVRYIHKQSFKDVTTARKTVDWSRIWFAFFMVIAINLPLFIIGYLLEPEIFVWNFDLIPFLILCAIAFLFLPLQTSFEEYLFRGYLMQGIGMLAKNRWVPLIFTSVLFGLLHSLNPEVEKLGYIMMVFYIGTGFLLGIMTLMDDGMELALGFHAANNIFAAILVTADWTAFQVPALFRDISEPSAGFDIVTPVVVIYPIYLFILARKYRWTDWKNKLFGKVEKPQTLKPSEEF